jgi:hypothetical protein
VELTCNFFLPALLKSLGVLFCQFLSGVTNVGEKFKERGRAVPIDFDGNLPEMNVRPTAASMHGISVSPRSLGFGLPRVVAFPLLYSGVGILTGIISVRLLRSCGPRRSTSNHGD